MYLSQSNTPHLISALFSLSILVVDQITLSLCVYATPLCHTLFLSMYACLSLYVCMFISLCMHVYLSMYVCFSLNVCMLISLCMYVSLTRNACLSPKYACISLYVCMFFFLCMYLSISIYVCIHLTKTQNRICLKAIRGKFAPGLTVTTTFKSE